jgi:hypothetical protein
MCFVGLNLPFPERGISVQYHSMSVESWNPSKQNEQNGTGPRQYVIYSNRVVSFAKLLLTFEDSKFYPNITTTLKILRFKPNELDFLNVVNEIQRPQRVNTW